MIILEVEVKAIDNQGRIILPKSWRDRYMQGKKVIVTFKGDKVEIKPFTKLDLTKYFDTVEVELNSDLSNWHKVRKELRRR